MQGSVPLWLRKSLSLYLLHLVDGPNCMGTEGHQNNGGLCLRTSTCTTMNVWHSQSLRWKLWYLQAHSRKVIWLWHCKAVTDSQGWGKTRGYSGSLGWLWMGMPFSLWSEHTATQQLRTNKKTAGVLICNWNHLWVFLKGDALWVVASIG